MTRGFGLCTTIVAWVMHSYIDLYNGFESYLSFQYVYSIQVLPFSLYCFGLNMSSLSADTVWCLEWMRYWSSRRRGDSVQSDPCGYSWSRNNWANSNNFAFNCHKINFPRIHATYCIKHTISKHMIQLSQLLLACASIFFMVKHNSKDTLRQLYEGIQISKKFFKKWSLEKQLEELPNN